MGQKQISRVRWQNESGQNNGTTDDTRFGLRSDVLSFCPLSSCPRRPVPSSFCPVLFCLLSPCHRFIMKHTTLTCLFAFVCVCVCGSTRAEVPSDSPQKTETPQSSPADLAEVQGTWVRTVKTDTGTYTITKEHRGNETTLTIKSAADRVVESKTSEFRLETTGKVRIFTFFNNRFTAGANRGRTANAPQSYIYRVTDDTFVEVRGMLIDDDSNPAVVTWKRVTK